MSSEVRAIALALRGVDLFLLWERIFPIETGSEVGNVLVGTFGSLPMLGACVVLWLWAGVEWR